MLREGGWVYWHGYDATWGSGVWIGHWEGRRLRFAVRDHVLRIDGPTYRTDLFRLSDMGIKTMSYN